MPRRQKLSYVDDAVSVGTRIRAARESRGFTQRDLSFPGCTAAYISRIERGERIPSLQVLREFADRLCVTEAFLARGDAASVSGDELWAQAKVALRLNEVETAREIAGQLLNSAQSDSSRAQVSVLLGQAAFHDGDHDAAIAALERSRQLDPSLEARDPDVGETLGRSYARRGDYAAAIAVFLRCYDAAVEAGSVTDRTRFGSLLANAYVDSGEFGQAETVLGDVGAHLDEIADPVGRARVLWTHSRLRTLQNDPEAAARYATQAVEILEIAEQDYHAALGYQLLAHIELDRGNGDAALELLEKGEPLIRAKGRPFEEAAFRLERVRALLQTGDRERAGAMAMEIAPRFAQGRPIDSGRSYLLLADVFRELGEDERAIEIYELAIERFGDLHNRYLVEALAKLAELLETCGRYEDAVAALKRGMRVQQDANRLLAPSEP